MYVIIISSSIILLLVIVFFLGLLSSRSSTTNYHRRQCPVCNRELDQDERVYADEIKRDSRPNQLKIKGCTHCYSRQ